MLINRILRLPVSAALAASIVVGVGGAVIDRRENDAFVMQWRDQIIDESNALSARINQRVSLYIGLLFASEAIVDGKPDLNKEKMEMIAQIAKITTRQLPGFTKMELSPNAIIAYVYPPESGKGVIGLNLRKDLTLENIKIVERTIADGKLRVAGPVKLVEGGEGIVVRNPVYFAGKFWGFITILIDYQSFFFTYPELQNAGDIEYALRGKDGHGAKGNVFLGDERIFSGDAVLTSIDFPNGEWQLAARPRAGWQRNRPGAGLFRASLLILMLGIGWITYIVRARGNDIEVRTEALNSKNTELHDTLVELQQMQMQSEYLVEQLTVQKEAAESANLAKSRFLAAASHDLRQPMHTISLLIGILRDQIRDPEVNNIVGKIQSSAQTMGDMFGSLLDISKFDAGAVHTNVQIFEIAELLRWIGANYEAQASEKGLTLRIVGSTTWVESDPALLERILGNLVSNAIRYTDRGGILVGCRRRGATLSVQVWDSGIGIATAQLDQIFEEFFQVANPERDRSNGLGLGLSIVKRCALLLGHPLTVRSEPGKGSVFGIELPLAATQPASPAIAPSPITSGLIANAFVVVVEDGVENLDATEALLRRWGCHVVGASSSRAAIEALQSHLRIPDLIISDYRLRDGLNGIAAIGAIRRWAEQPIPAILVTGDMSTTEQLQASDASFSLLHKPVGADQLRRLAEELLAHPVRPV